MKSIVLRKIKKAYPDFSRSTILVWIKQYPIETLYEYSMNTENRSIHIADELLNIEMHLWNTKKDHIEEIDLVNNTLNSHTLYWAFDQLRRLNIKKNIEKIERFLESRQ